MDANRPAHWQVVENKTGKVKADKLSHAEALARCETLEPNPEITGFRYTMQPVRG